MHAFTLAVACCIWGTNPLTPVTIDQVDMIEYNHFFDEQGRHVFDQLIFYDWSPREQRYHVRDWRMIKEPSQFPYRDPRRDLYLVTWQDGQVLRQVRARIIRESWTQHDPELSERSYLPKEHRRELSLGTDARQLLGREIFVGAFD